MQGEETSRSCTPSTSQSQTKEQYTSSFSDIDSGLTNNGDYTSSFSPVEGLGLVNTEDVGEDTLHSDYSEPTDDEMQLDPFDVLRNPPEDLKSIFENNEDLVIQNFETLPLRSIPLRSIQLKEILGCGNFGSVHRGQWDGAVVAVKILANCNQADVKREIEQMSRLHHPRLVRFYGVCFEDNTPRVHIVMEYCPGGDLRTFLTLHRVSWQQKLRFCIDTALALGCLHKHGIIHRDLSVSNILLDLGNRVKLADFGLSANSQNSDRLKYAQNRNPPEVYLEGISNEKSDVYCFGVVMWEIATTVENQEQTYERKVSEKYY